MEDEISFNDIQNAYSVLGLDQQREQEPSEPYKLSSADIRQARAGVDPIEEPEDHNPIEEFGRGIAEGVLELGVITGGATKFAGDLAGSKTISRLGEDSLGYWAEKARSYAADVGSLSDIDSFSDFTKYAAHGIGSLVPMMAGTVASGGAGAIAAGGASRVGAKVLAKQLTKEMAEKAITRGAVAGAAAGSYGMELGSIYADQNDQGIENPARAALYAAPAAALDVIPEMRIMSKIPIFKTLQEIPIFRTEEGRNFLTRGIKEAVKQGGIEGGTEYAQTLFELAGAYKDPFSKEGQIEALNAGVIGGLGGAVIGGGAGMFSKGGEVNDVDLTGGANDAEGNRRTPLALPEPNVPIYDAEVVNDKPTPREAVLPVYSIGGALQIEQHNSSGVGGSPQYGSTVNLGGSSEPIEMRGNYQSLPAPAINVTPGGTAFTREDMNSLINSGIQQKESQEKALEMTDEDIAMSKKVIDGEANRAATSSKNKLPQPTQAQQEAGNYKKGHVKIHGLDIAIENPKGGKRSGVDPNGEAWSVEMPAHYGYFKRTEGADGDQVDVYIGEHPQSEKAFIVDQVDPDTGAFDEHKVIIGANSLGEAKKIYDGGFSDGSGPQRAGAITETSIDGLKDWLGRGDQGKPLRSEVNVTTAESENAATTEDVAERATQNAVRSAAAIPMAAATATAEKGAVVEADVDHGTPSKVNTVGLSKRFGEMIGSLDRDVASLDKFQVKKALADLWGKKVSELNDSGDYDHKAVEEAMELAVVKKAREVMRGPGSFDAKFEKIKRLYKRQPNLLMRTGKSMSKQQYSTPSPIAALMQHWLGIDENGGMLIYEPTAGNGALISGAEDLDSVIVNELDSGARLDNLKAFFKDNGVPEGNVFNTDATDLNLSDYGLPKAERIIANPPFGSIKPVKIDGFPISKLEHLIVAKSLEQMTNDGKAAFIIGGHNFNGKGRMSEPDRMFFNWLYSHYNVAHNVDVNGDLYRRQGTSFDIRVIAVDGRKSIPDKEFAPARSGQVETADTFDRLYDILKTEGGKTYVNQHENREPTVSDNDGVSRDGQERGARNDSADDAGDTAARAEIASKREHERNVSVRNSRGSADSSSDAGDGGSGGSGARSERNGEAADRRRGSSVISSVGSKPVGSGKSRLTGGEQNKIFTQEAADKAAAILRKKLSQVNSGFDPELLSAGIQIAGYHIEKGIRKFSDFAKTMVEAFGEGVKPHLKGWYKAISSNYGDQFSGMDNDAAVDATDINGAVSESATRDAAKVKTESSPEKVPSRNGKPNKAAMPKRNKFQAPYSPQSNREPGGNLIPVNMEKKVKGALESLEDETGKTVDDYLTEKLQYGSVNDLWKALSAEQIDAVALAVDAIDKGEAIIIGDQTGVGKGRSAAAIIRYANLNEHVPVFTTALPKLFTDMWGDLNDIGYGDMKPFIMHSNPDSDIVDGSGEVLIKRHGDSSLYQEILDSGNVKQWFKDHGYGVVFTSYSQVQEGMKKLQSQILTQLSVDNIVVMDEAHEAAGDSNRGKVFSAALQDAAGVLYLSATFAKRPDNIPIYFRTAIGSSGLSRQGLIDAMARGGVPLQQAIASLLAESGQMIRRESSWDGISIAYETDTTNAARDEQRADQVTAILRRIVQFDKLKSKSVDNMNQDAQENGMAVTGEESTSAGVTSTNFSSIVHNIVSQLLLALKADMTADRAIEIFKRGEKPIINLTNTMESTLEHFIDASGYSLGEAVSADFSTVLDKALEGTRRIRVTDPYGNSTRSIIPVEQLTPEAQDIYYGIKAQIERLDLDLPLSPIDYIAARMRDEGCNVGEITGRKYAVRYDFTNGKKNLIAIEPRKIRKGEKNKSVIDFNNKRTDALIFNSAGSTGLSLHNSPKTGTDRRRRIMLMVQPDPNINTMMQGMGRSNRKGQLVADDNGKTLLPGYIFPSTSLPAEIRPNVIRQKKMASLNANTSANDESVVSSTRSTDDMMNRHGDAVTREFLANHPDISELLDIDTSAEGLFQRVSGKIAILPSRAQREFYEEVEQEYSDLMDYLDRTGQNDLKSSNLDYRAKTLESVTIHQGADEGNPFAASAYLETLEVNVLRKPYNSEKVKELVRKALDGRTRDQYNAGLISQLDRMEADYEAKVREDKADLEPEQLERTISRLITYPASVIRNALKGVNSQYDDLVIGGTYEVNIEEGYNPLAVLTGMRFKRGTNPVALSRFELEFAVADSMQTISLPMSRDTQLRATRLKNYGFSSEGWDRATPKKDREKVRVVTGNLLYGYQQTRGQIVNFTTEDGDTRQGILVPKGESSENLGKTTFVTADAALSYLKTKIGSSRVSTVNANIPGVSISYDHYNGEATVRVPGDKRSREKYYTDEMQALFARDYRKVQGSAVANVNAENLGRVLDIFGSEHQMSFGVSSEFAAGRGSIQSKSGEKTTTLNSGIPVDALVQEIVKLKRNTAAAFPKLVDLGLHLLKGGHDSLASFTAKMEELLGSSYEVFRDMMIKVFDFVRRKLKEERGSVSFEQKQSESDAATRESMKNGSEKVTRETTRRVNSKLNGYAAGKAIHDFAADRMHERLKTLIGNIIATPLFQAEKNPLLRVFVKEQIRRQEDNAKTKASFMEYETRDGKKRTLQDLRKDFRNLTAVQRKMVQKLIVEGDAFGVVYDTIDDARRYARLRNVDEAAFKHYKELRGFIGGLRGKLINELMENALERYNHKPEIKSRLRKMLSSREAMDFSEIESDVYKAYMDMQGLKLIFPEYQNKPWFNTLVEILTDKDARNDWQTTVKDKNIDEDLRQALKTVMENKIIERRVKRAARNLVESRKALRDLKSQVGNINGWFPRIREDGVYRVSVNEKNEDGSDGREVFMQMVNSKAAARELRKKLMENPKEFMPVNFKEAASYSFPEPTIVNKLSEEMYGSITGDIATQQLIQKAINGANGKVGINAELFEEISNALMRETADAILSRGAGRHQIRRKANLIEGYNTSDVYGTLDQYIRGASGYVTKSRYAIRQMHNLNQTKPEAKEWAFSYVKDSLANSGYADRISARARGVATLWFLGLKMSSAVVNATQNMTFGQAELSRYTKSAGRVMTKAHADLLSDYAASREGRLTEKITKSERAALWTALRQGLVHETVIGDMIAEDRNPGTFMDKNLQRALKFTMAPFQAIERINREAAFLAAYRSFQPQGFKPTAEHPFHQDAFDKASEFVYTVHFIPGKANLPKWARNWAGRTVYTLQSFAFNSLNWMYNRATSGERDQVIALGRAIAAIAVLGGIGAVPGADDIDKLVRKITGKDYRLEFESWMHKHASEYGDPGDAAVDFIFYGLPSTVGLNISNSLAVRVPILSNFISGDSVTESATGPVGALIQKGFNAVDSFSNGDYYRALESAAPEFMAGPMRAYRLASEGATTKGGKPIYGKDGSQVKYDGTDAFKRSLGFQPLEQSKQSNLQFVGYELKNYWQERKSQVYAKIRRLFENGSAKGRQEAHQLVLEFNAQLMSSQARSLVSPIRSLKQALHSRPDKKTARFTQENDI